ncbi:hypothetical protein SCACP_05080 [Sporomusa carbonis]|uniref:hypothetical protein n=1 Tax=Sporomusa carbonis TaxID=3076075 RepID=UPI003A72E4BE
MIYEGKAESALSFGRVQPEIDRVQTAAQSIPMLTALGIWCLSIRLDADFVIYMSGYTAVAHPNFRAALTKEANVKGTKGSP